MARVLFIECTSTEFNRLVSKDADTIYWLSDTREIFKGDIGYGSNVKFESQIPEFNEAEENVLYVVNQAGKIQLLVKGDSATTATNATNDGTGKNIAETYATKAELSSNKLVWGTF